MTSNAIDNEKMSYSQLNFLLLKYITNFS